MSAADVDFPSDLRSLENDYELIRELGQGGMAAVYLARQRKSGRVVAIKAIRARYLDDPDALQRFAREARTVAGLDHPNIVRTEAIEQIGDRAVAIIMEHVHGGTVRDRLREFGSLGAEDAEGILRDVANALGYAHRRGIVHRDVKPENIFLDPTRRRALLSDFGIARNDTDAGITLLGAALGTPQYMSPEQIDGEKVDGRSDIYSLGVLGWELLTGRRPWAGESLYGVIYKQKHEDLPRITSLRPRVPANLLFAIEGALVKDKARRFQTVDEFVDQLTYNPPPLLSQTYPPGAMRADYERTVRFRSATVRDDSLGAVDPVDAELETPTVITPVDPERSEHVGEPIALATADVELPASPLFIPASANDDTTDPSVPEGALALPDFDPNATASFEFRPRRLRLMQAAGLFVPLTIAAVSLFIFLGGSSTDGARQGGNSLTSSAGRVGLDSVPNDAPSIALARDPAVKPAAPAATTRPTQGVVGGNSVGLSQKPIGESRRGSRASPEFPRTRRGSTTAALPPQTLPINPVRIDSNRQTPAVRPPDDATEASGGTPKVEASSGAKPAPIDDPFKMPSSTKPDAALGSKSVPSPRCLIGKTADQEACLSAYVAVGDAPLANAFDALVSEMRRVAHSAPDAPDPATVQRIRLEQRAWKSIRESECSRTAAPGTGLFWAQAQADCFNDMAKARAAELRDAVRRLKRK